MLKQMMKSRGALWSCLMPLLMLCALMMGGLNAQAAEVQPDGPPNTSGALITEFRISGKNGATDEYVEIYNNTAGDLNISGWKLVTVGGTTVVPTPTIMKPRAHYLFAGADYSLNSYAPRDLALVSDIPVDSNIRLLNAGGAEVDAIQATPAPTTEPATDYAYVRRVSSGSQAGVPQDTNQLSDFIVVTTNGAAVSGNGSSNVPAQLGSPSPHSSTSLVQSGSISVNFLDAGNGVAASATPNQQRFNDTVDNGLGTPNRFGTLRLRRSLTNIGTVAISRVRFHTVRITTLNDTGYGDPAQADVRLLSSPDEAAVPTSSGPKAVQGTTLEAPPSDLAFGGGLNSNAGIVTLPTPLEPGTTQNYSFELGVARRGNFLFGFTIEGDPAVTTGDDAYNLILGPTGQRQQAGVTLLSSGVFQIAAPGVAANDGFLKGTALTVRPTSNPKNGRFQLRNDGSLFYLPSTGTIGVDEFTYSVSDGKTTATATIRLNVVDKREPELRLDVPRDRATVASVPKVVGRVRDRNAGLKSVTLLWQRFDGKFWNGNAWTATATELPLVVQGIDWNYTGKIPALGTLATTSLLVGRYDLRVTATDKSGNISKVTNRITVASAPPIAGKDTVPLSSLDVKH